MPKTWLPRLKLILSISFALHFGQFGAAGEVANIREIGEHYIILVLEKNVHPENQMVIYTKIDANGRFVADPANRNQPVFDFYWLMRGRDYKPVHALIKFEVRKRFESQWISRDHPDRFTVRMNDLKELECDIEEPKMDVYVRGTGVQPGVEAEISLGPSDGNNRIKLTSIHTEGRALPPAVYAVTLKGREIVNGNATTKKITRRYEARR